LIHHFFPISFLWGDEDATSRRFLFLSTAFLYVELVERCVKRYRLGQTFCT